MNRSTTQALWAAALTASLSVILLADAVARDRWCPHTVDEIVACPIEIELTLCDGLSPLPCEERVEITKLMDSWNCKSEPGSNKECYTPTHPERPEEADVRVCIRYRSCIKAVGGCIIDKVIKETYRDFRKTVPC
jgi:hypothetical protein